MHRSLVTAGAYNEVSSTLSQLGTEYSINDTGETSETQVLGPNDLQNPFEVAQTLNGELRPDASHSR